MPYQHTAELSNDLRIELFFGSTPLTPFIEKALSTPWNAHLSHSSREKLLSYSFNALLVFNEIQIGYARFLTDTLIFSSLCDLYIASSYRNQGLGATLLKHCLSSPPIRHTYCIMQDSNYNTSFFAKHGFKPVPSSPFPTLFRLPLSQSS